MSLLFDGIDAKRRLTVLDIGAGTPETVRFFSSFRCRLFFADLFGETGLQRPPRERRKSSETVFEHIFDFPGDTVFDLCLLWDFLNYLDMPLLRDLASTLSRHVHGGTRAYGFAPFSNALPYSCMLFSLEAKDRLVVRPNPIAPPYPHANREIARALWPFVVARAVLLGENRQELVLGVRRS